MTHFDEMFDILGKYASTTDVGNLIDFRQEIERRSSTAALTITVREDKHRTLGMEPLLPTDGSVPQDVLLLAWLEEGKRDVFGEVELSAVLSLLDSAIRNRRGPPNLRPAGRLPVAAVSRRATLGRVGLRTPLPDRPSPSRMRTQARASPRASGRMTFRESAV